MKCDCCRTKESVGKLLDTYKEMAAKWFALEDALEIFNADMDNLLGKPMDMIVDVAHELLGIDYYSNRGDELYGIFYDFGFRDACTRDDAISRLMEV